MRRVQGIDRVYFTCSVCHAGSVREAPGAAARIVLGMPANTVNFGGVADFLRRTAHDGRFTAARLMPQIEAPANAANASTGARPYRPAEFGVLDRRLFQYIGVDMMREHLAG